MFARAYMKSDTVELPAGGFCQSVTVSRNRSIFRPRRIAGQKKWRRPPRTIKRHFSSKRREPHGVMSQDTWILRNSSSLPCYRHTSSPWLVKSSAPVTKMLVVIAKTVEYSLMTHYDRVLTYNNNNKGKFTLEQATKAQRRSRGVALLFL
jgi:hypothetical protein